MRRGAWAQHDRPATSRRTLLSKLSSGTRTRSGTRTLLRNDVGIHLTARARADRLVGHRYHRTAGNLTGHGAARHHRWPCRSSAGRNAQSALSGPCTPRLTPILHESGRPGPHIRPDIRFRERIVDIERPRIGIARTREKLGKRCRSGASTRNEQHRGRHCGNNTRSATVDHFPILRNGRQVPGRIDCRSGTFSTLRTSPRMILPVLQNREQAGFDRRPAIELVEFRQC